jgi:hypothetical protein
MDDSMEYPASVIFPLAPVVVRVGGIEEGLPDE